MVTPITAGAEPQKEHFGLGELEGTYEPSESGAVVAAKKYAAQKAAQMQKVERA